MAKQSIDSVVVPIHYSKLAHVSGTSLQRQASAFLEIARRHARELQKAGFSHQELEGLHRAVIAYEAARSARHAGEDKTRQALLALRRLLAGAKIFRIQLLAALRLLASKGLPESASLIRTQPRHADASQYLEWLAEVKQVIESMSKPLSSCLEEPVHRAAELQRKLFGALGDYQAARRMLPSATQAVRAGRARVVLGLDQIRWAARIAFAGEPELLRQFRKAGLVPRKRKPLAALTVTDQGTSPNQEVKAA